MSAESRRSSREKAAKRLDRPFDPAILRRAEAIAARYRVILEPEEGVGYLGRGLELPNVMGDGATPNECVKNVREALVAVVAHLLERRKNPPAPSIEGRRTAQINVRLTEEEKLLLEEMARREGFRGVADYVRTKSLAGTK